MYIRSVSPAIKLLIIFLLPFTFTGTNLTPVCLDKLSNIPSVELCVTATVTRVLPDKKSFIFDNRWDIIGIHSKEVNDFHVLDKNQIFSIHHSAIQELSKKHENEVNAKDERITELENKNASLQSRLSSLEAAVIAIQQNLN